MKCICYRGLLDVNKYENKKIVSLLEQENHKKIVWIQVLKK